MRLFKRGKERGGSTAVVERPVVDRPTEVTDDFPGSTDELFAEIERLTETNRADRDRETERRLVHLRHIAGLRVLIENGAKPKHPEPDFERLPAAEVLPEIAPEDLTPELLRAGILRDGCLLVRGLVDREAALAVRGPDRPSVRRARAASAPGSRPPRASTRSFEPCRRSRSPQGARLWVQEGGGLLAPDAPMLTFEMLEMFASAGLPELVGAYLGERPLISLQKTTLRKAEPHVPGAWHQDGAFMGDVRALNLWLSLSRCGDESPGLDVVPRRLDQIVATATDDAVLDYQVSQAKAEEAAGDKRITRPIFEPGDALFFDELFLHQTGSDPVHAEAALRHRELVLRRLGVPGRVRPDRGLAPFELHDDPSAAAAVDGPKAEALVERLERDHLEAGRAATLDPTACSGSRLGSALSAASESDHSPVQQEPAAGTKRGDRLPQGRARAPPRRSRPPRGRPAEAGSRGRSS